MGGTEGQLAQVSPCLVPTFMVNTQHQVKHRPAGKPSYGNRHCRSKHFNYGSQTGRGLVRLARYPYPLPLAGLKARRSLLALDNLVEAIDTVFRAPEPLRRPLIVADPEPLTIGEMVAAMRQGLVRRVGLFPVPSPLLEAFCGVTGRAEMYQRLSGSL